MNIPNNNTQNAILIFRRLKEMAYVRHDKELAELLGMAPTTLSTQKRRNALDYGLVIDFCAKMGFDLNYVLLGEKNTLPKTGDNSVEDGLQSILKGLIKQELTPKIEELSRLRMDVENALDRLRTKEEIESAKKKLGRMVE